MKINGKIIRIVDKTTVIINLGKNNGITYGSIFSILGNPEPIMDPFTKEELGLVSIVKSKVKAAQIHDKFTIASTRLSSTYIKGQAAISNYITSFFETDKFDEGELLVNSNDLQPWKAKSETPVTVGDIVEVEIAVQSTASEKTGKLSNGGSTEQAQEGNSAAGEPAGQKPV
jgi:hypothetical protein